MDLLPQPGPVPSKVGTMERRCRALKYEGLSSGLIFLGHMLDSGYGIP